MFRESELLFDNRIEILPVSRGLSRIASNLRSGRGEQDPHWRIARKNRLLQLGPDIGRHGGKRGLDSGLYSRV